MAIRSSSVFREKLAGYLYVAICRSVHSCCFRSFAPIGCIVFFFIFSFLFVAVFRFYRIVLFVGCCIGIFLGFYTGQSIQQQGCSQSANGSVSILVVSRNEHSGGEWLFAVGEFSATLIAVVPSLPIASVCFLYASACANPMDLISAPAALPLRCSISLRRLLSSLPQPYCSLLRSPPWIWQGLPAHRRYPWHFPYRRAPVAGIFLLVVGCFFLLGELTITQYLCSPRDTSYPGYRRL